MSVDAVRQNIERHGRRYRVDKKFHGIRIRKSFDSLEQATSFLEDLERRVDDQRRAVADSAPTPLTVGDLVERWFADHRRRLQPGTQFDYEWRIRHDISKIADFDAHELIRDPSILHDFYWNQLGPQSARNARTIILQAFEEAVMRKLIPENPARGQKLPSAQSADKDIPTPVEVAKMILAGEEDRLWGLFVKITATLGTRRGETCALRWEDFDAGSQRVLLRRAACVSVDVLTVKAPKSGRSRTLHIPSDAFWGGLEEFRLSDGSCSAAGFVIPFGAGSWSSEAKTNAGTSTQRATGSVA